MADERWVTEVMSVAITQQPHSEEAEALATQAGEQTESLAEEEREPGPAPARCASDEKDDEANQQ
jgi:hypothetical protein